jgi:hypothetical protein
MSDERIWYAVNHVTGRDLIGAGIVLLVTSTAIHLFGHDMNPDYATVILLAVMVASVMVMVVNSIRVQNRM